MIVEDNPAAFDTAVLSFLKIGVSIEAERSFFMSKREMIVPKGMESVVEKFHYAPAVRVDNTLYISGQLGRDENLQVIEGAEAQYTQAFENLKKVLEAADATLENVVDVVTYHTDMRDMGACLTKGTFG